MDQTLPWTMGMDDREQGKDPHLHPCSGVRHLESHITKPCVLGGVHCWGEGM